MILELLPQCVVGTEKWDEVAGVRLNQRDKGTSTARRRGKDNNAVTVAFYRVTVKRA